MREWAAAFAAYLLIVLCAAPASAGPALLFDTGNGKILYAEEPDSQWHPASLTKVMTAYITFEAIKAGKLRLDSKIPCSLVATLQPPSKVGLNVGAELTVEQALKAIIIKSANDVTVMLAEAVAGSERAFVDQMNETARRLGMTRTNFVNTNGLPEPAQVTTARDLALLGRAVLRDYPQYAPFWSQPEMRIGKKRLASHNALLKTYPGADGLKTGFTCDSGFNVIASASRDGRHLMAVVLGETSGPERSVRAASLLEHGFANYGWKELFGAERLDTMPVDPAAKSVQSVRELVSSWDCGGRKRKKIAKNKKRPAGAPGVELVRSTEEKEVIVTVQPQPSGTGEREEEGDDNAASLPLKGSLTPQLYWDQSPEVTRTPDAPAAQATP